MSAPAPAPSPAAAPRHASGNAWRRLSGAGVYLFVIALLLAGRALSPDFWSWDKNLLLVLQDVSILGIVAVGLAFVTCSGNYVDLSIPAIMAIAGIVAVYLLPFGLLPAAAAGLVVGTLLGLINGWVVGCLRANPILWTMAAMAMADGITRWAYGGKWQYVDAAAPTGRVFAALYGGKAFGVAPLPVLFLAVAAAAAHVLMNHTAYGRRLRLTGAAPEAARASGIAAGRVVAASFAVCGFTAALAGLVKTSFAMYGDVEIGATYDFQAVTAVVLGGVSLAGGRGGIPGVIGGVLVIGLLGRILPLVPGIGQDEQYVIRGAIFIAVVGLNMYALRREGRSDA